MRPSQPGRLGLVALLVGVLSWAVLRMLADRGYGGPAPTWGSVFGPLLLAAVVFAAGWPVRQWVRGDRSERTRRIDALRAARTAVLAKASAHVGAVLVGWYSGQAVLQLPDLDLAIRREYLLLAALAASAAVLVVVAGLVVERFCRVPPGNHEE